MSKKYFELLNSEKNIDDFSVDEAKIALEWLNINHNQFNDWDGVIEDIASIFKAETL
ncbi:MAG: hypothetical protein LBQ24_06785 [Candidatus Peribacteria bacterium]|jgi:hypothetical protein|nr:hypothetical protein [Candidatus Peribacteria bacterium]